MVLDRRPGPRRLAGLVRVAGRPAGGVYVTPAGRGRHLAALQAARRAAPLGIDLERTRHAAQLRRAGARRLGSPGRLLALRRELRVVQVDSRRSPERRARRRVAGDRAGRRRPAGTGARARGRDGGAARVSRELRAALAAASPPPGWPRVGSKPPASRRSPARWWPLARRRGRRWRSGRRPAGEGRRAGDRAPERGPGKRRPRGRLRSPAAAARAAGRRAAALRRAARRARRLGRACAILDAADDGRALPWAALRADARADALVVSLSPFDRGLARHAALLVPSPAPLEALRRGAADGRACARASYALAAPLLPTPGRARGLDALVAGSRARGCPRVEVAAGGHARGAPAAARRGDPRRGAAAGSLARADDGYADATAADADAAWELLVAGGCWIDDPPIRHGSQSQPAPLPAPATLERWRQAEAAAAELALVAFAARGTAGATPPSPLLTQALPGVGPAASAGDRRRSPDDGRRRSASRRAAASGSRARCGNVLAELRCDPLLPPGRLALARRPRRRRASPGDERARRGARCRWSRSQPTVPGARPASRCGRPEPWTTASTDERRALRDGRSTSTAATAAAPAWWPARSRTTCRPRAERPPSAPASPGCACTGSTAPGEARAAFVPMMCQQCGAKTPCVSVCPQNAVEVDPGSGIVAQIPVRCLGCRYCMAACPYHARSFNWWDPDWPGRLTETLNPEVSTRTRGVVEKCSFCSHRLQAAQDAQAARAAADADAARVHARLRRGLPGRGDRRSATSDDPQSEVARLAQRTRLLPPAGAARDRTRRSTTAPSATGCAAGRRPHGASDGRQPWMNDSCRAAATAPPSAASCSGSRPGRRCSRSGSTPAYLCLALGLNQTNMDNRFAFGLWIYLDLTVIALGAGAFFTGFLLYVMKKQRAARPSSTARWCIGFICYSGAVAILAIDVGQPLRAWFTFWHPNVHSMLTEVTFCLTLLPDGARHRVPAARAEEPPAPEGARRCSSSSSSCTR